MTIDSYLAQLADAMPKMLPERDQIIADVRTHIDEEMQRGEAFDSVLAKFGDPGALAASYLSEVRLVSASFLQRGLAMAVDVAMAGFIAIPLAVFAQSLGQDGQNKMLIDAAIFGAFAVTIGFVVYILIGDCRFGQTLGKHWLKLLVVQESGARISLGQAVVRLLPCVLHIWWIDVMFALFTEKHQRAFELLSKTRVINIAPAYCPQPRHRPSGSRAKDQPA